MRLHCSSRRAASAALGIFLLVLSGTATIAGAAPSPDGRGRESAPGQAKKAEPAPAPASTPSAGTPTAADHPEDDSSHDATNGPGGQVCDGDPSGKSDGGGGANGGGENYDNTCPAGPSQNGAGDGEANGKPCAGCVGNADDKNPPGQYPSGPEDHNNGYECDQKGRSAKEGNNGIGFGNPAHSGCAGTVTPPPPPPPPPATCPDGMPLPAGGAEDCGPTCPDGSAMPASGDTKDCGVKTCPDGSAMPASGDTKDCGVKTCPDGSAMPASGDTKDCTPPACIPTEGVACTPVEVLGVATERPTEVLGVQLSAEAPADDGVLAAAAGLARTGAGLHGLLQLALVLGLAGTGLTLGARRRLEDDSVDIAERLRSY